VTVPGKSYLLDTNIAIWLDGRPQLVSPSVHQVLGDPDCAIFLSTVSFWELSVKQRIGKIDPTLRLELMVERYGVAELPVTSKYTGVLRDLPLLHRDPFDRMLVAQAMVEGMTLVTGDGRLARYAVSVLRV
jgi:PIN domain nuclease of toxin-antitoxin system